MAQQRHGLIIYKRGDSCFYSKGYRNFYNNVYKDTVK